MGVSTIDGTVESAELRRTARGISIFKSVTFRLNDGSNRTITKAVAKKAVADHLVPGSAGRFYMFTGFDLKGVHGVRKSDGTAVCDFPSGNAKLFLVMGGVNLLWVVLRLSTDGQIPMLGVLLMILAAVGYTLLSKTEREAKAQFSNDGAAAPAPSTVDAPEAAG